MTGATIPASYVQPLQNWANLQSPYRTESITCPAGGFVVSIGVYAGTGITATAPSKLFAQGGTSNRENMAKRDSTGIIELTGVNGFAAWTALAFAPAS